MIDLPTFLNLFTKFLITAAFGFFSYSNFLIYSSRCKIMVLTNGTNAENSSLSYLHASNQIVIMSLFSLFSSRWNCAGQLSYQPRATTLRKRLALHDIQVYPLSERFVSICLPDLL